MYGGAGTKIWFAPSIRFKRLHKLLEVTTAPIRKTPFNVSLLYRQFLLRQRFSYDASMRSRKTTIGRQEYKPVSINSCAAWRSSSSFSGVSSGPGGSRNVAAIPLSRCQHQSAFHNHDKEISKHVHTLCTASSRSCNWASSGGKNWKS
jgi:hypothetical protein